MRCFLALPLETPALQRAQHLLASLQQRVPHVRWAREETLHVTLHFFGNIPDDDVTRALDAVSPVTSETPTFAVALDELDTFPPRGWPRVLWLGCSYDNPALMALATKCQQALAATGFAVENRAFKAHCTLGRPRVPWSSDARAAWNAAVRQRRTPYRFEAKRVVLYESHLGKGGSVYEERRSLPLRGGS